MRTVVDANVVAALFIDLAYSARARAAVANAEEIVAPDLITAELSNALWKLIASRHIDMNFARRALEGLSAVVSEFVPGLELAADAVRHATVLGHPAYDCFYLTLAKRRGAKLLTADRRFAAALERLDPPIDYEFIVA